MKEKIEQIIDRNTEGNYLLSATDKAQMVSEILDLFGVGDSFISKFEEIIYGGLSDSEIVNALQKLDNERYPLLCDGRFISTKFNLKTK